MIFKPKRGPLIKLKKLTPENGEMLFAIDTRELFIGDGIKLGGIYIGNVPIEITGFDVSSKSKKSSNPNDIFDIFDMFNP